MKPHQLEYLKKMHAGEGTWLRDAEIDSLFVEIERQRALIEEQQIFINKIKELSSSLEEGDKSKLWQMLKASNDSKDLVND